MHNLVPQLLLYGDMPKDSILMELCDIFAQAEIGTERKDILITRVHREIKRILEVATNFGFDKNLWHNYLTFLLITNENIKNLLIPRSNGYADLVGGGEDFRNDNDYVNLYSILRVLNFENVKNTNNFSKYFTHLII